MTENVSHNTSFDSLESKPTPNTDQLVGEIDPNLFDVNQGVDSAHFDNLGGNQFHEQLMAEALERGQRVGFGGGATTGIGKAQEIFVESLQDHHPSADFENQMLLQAVNSEDFQLEDPAQVRTSEEEDQNCSQQDSLAANQEENQTFKINGASFGPINNQQASFAQSRHSRKSSTNYNQFMQESKDFSLVNSTAHVHAPLEQQSALTREQMTAIAINDHDYEDIQKIELGSEFKKESEGEFVSQSSEFNSKASPDDQSRKQILKEQRSVKKAAFLNQNLSQQSQGKKPSYSSNQSIIKSLNSSHHHQQKLALSKGQNQQQMTTIQASINTNDPKYMTDRVVSERISETSGSKQENQELQKDFVDQLQQDIQEYHKEGELEPFRNQEFAKGVKRQSFPTSDDSYPQAEIGDQLSEIVTNQTSQQDQVQSKALGALLLGKISERARMRNMLSSMYLRQAFDRLTLISQSKTLEELWSDNENLLEQLQVQQIENQEQKNTIQMYKQENELLIKKMDSMENKSKQVLTNSKSYSPVSQIKINEKSDQTSNKDIPQVFLDNLNNFKVENSSNKDMSPADASQQNRQPNSQRESSFLRQMLRDDSSMPSILPAIQQQNSSQLQQNKQKLFNESNQQKSLFCEDFAQRLNKVIQSIDSDGKKKFLTEEIKDNLEQLLTTFNFEVEKVRAQCSLILQTHSHLAQRCSNVDRIELENLELHMQLDAKLRALESVIRCGGGGTIASSTDASKLFALSEQNQQTVETQTDTVYSELQKREVGVKLLSDELALVKVRQEEEFGRRESDLRKRECDIDIRERLIEEKRVEYSFKQKELNQRIKSQMTWPLNCLENETRLLEKFKDFKLMPDHLKQLQADSNLSLFLEREENIAFMQTMSGEMLQKCEGLLHYEYLLLQERAKNIIFHDNLMIDLENTHQQAEELAQDRERYSLATDYERLLQEDKIRIEKSRKEVEKIQDHLNVTINKVSQTILANEESKKLSHKKSESNNYESPEVKAGQADSNNEASQGPLNQMNLLLGSLQLPCQSGSKQGTDQSPQINLYSEQINAKNGAALLQVIEQYRDQDPLLAKYQVRDLQSLIERTLDIFECNLSKESSSALNDSPNGKTSSANLRQIRRMLVRDAYFLQKERSWLDQERLKLQSLQQKQFQSQFQEISHNYREGEKVINYQLNGNLVNGSQKLDHFLRESSNLSNQDIFKLREKQHDNDREINQFANEAIQHDISSLSNFEQEKKKIQLLQQNIMLEQEYNRDLSSQLNNKMELLKVQNEALLENENQINEMKLKLLLRFETVKMLEDFYNKQHAHLPDHQITVDIELDRSQLLSLAERLHQQNIFQLEERRKVIQKRALDGLVAISRHLLMSRCKNQSRKVRQKYAFLQLKLLLLGNPDNLLAGDQSFALNQSILTDTIREHNQTLHSIRKDSSVTPTIQQNQSLDNSRQYEQPILSPKPINDEKQVVLSQKLVGINQGVNTNYVVQLGTDSQDDWFAIFWEKKRLDYIPQALTRELSPEVNLELLKSAQIRLERDSADFWKFRASNTLRLMNLYAKRRARLICYFAFQKFRVQATRLSLGKALYLLDQQMEKSEDQRISKESGKEVNTTEGHDNSMFIKENDELISEVEDPILENNKISSATEAQNLSVENRNGHDQMVININQGNNQMMCGVIEVLPSTYNEQNDSYTLSQKLQLRSEDVMLKKSALVTLLSVCNQKYTTVRSKSLMFSRWKAAVREEEAMTMRVELARLGSEVETIKLHEELLRTNFILQRNELESKLSILVSLIGRNYSQKTH